MIFQIHMLSLARQRQVSFTVIIITVNFFHMILSFLDKFLPFGRQHQKEHLKGHRELSQKLVCPYIPRTLNYSNPPCVTCCHKISDGLYDQVEIMLVRSSCCSNEIRDMERSRSPDFALLELLPRLESNQATLQASGLLGKTDR